MQVRTGHTDGQEQTCPLVIKWIFEPYLPPVHRIRACQLPPFKARMFTESIVQRVQANSPREPNSSRSKRWSLAHTRVSDHSLNRR